MDLRRYRVVLALAVVLAGPTAAHAKGDSAFVSFMPVSGDFGNEGFTYSPPLTLQLMHGRWTLGVGGYHAWTNSDAKLVRGVALPKGWGYSLDVEYALSSSEEDVRVVSTHREVVGSQYIMGVGTLLSVRYYSTDAGIEHRVYGRALRFGVSGGRKQREFTPLLEDLGDLPVRTPSGTDTKAETTGGLYGTATQHRAYLGHEWIMLVPPVFALKGFVDLQFLLAETVGEELGTMSDVYVATPATRSALQPGFLGRFGLLAGWEARIWYFRIRFAGGFEPGTGGGLAQIQAGPAFSF